jgi:hypothetical protein
MTTKCVRQLSRASSYKRRHPRLGLRGDAPTTSGSLPPDRASASSQSFRGWFGRGDRRCRSSHVMPNHTGGARACGRSEPSSLQSRGTLGAEHHIRRQDQVVGKRAIARPLRFWMAPLAQLAGQRLHEPSPVHLGVICLQRRALRDDIKTRPRRR